MASNIIKVLRSLVSGSRPSTGHTYGEPYVNLADNQFGVMDSSNVARDLIGVPIFSSGASYSAGQPVIQAGNMYTANVAISPGSFNSAQWTIVRDVVRGPASAPVDGDVVLFDTTTGRLVKKKRGVF